jgi:Nis1 family
VLYNVTKWVNVPSDVAKGPATLTASLFSLIGAANGGNINNFNVSVTVGDATSTNYVSSALI